MSMATESCRIVGESMRPSVALVMIARDEERCVGRALASVAPLVDDMVVVDTGSSDDTPRLAMAAGARVHEFEWRDDFAAAKNFGLSLSRADLRLVLDADEWVDGGQAEFNSWLIATEWPAYGTVACRSAFDANGDVQTVTDHLVRLMPAGAKFQGSVHEQPVGAFPVHRSPLVVEHDGYLEAQLARKVGRNERLLRTQLSADDENGYAWYQLGCALSAERRHKEAAQAFDRALNLLDDTSPQRHPLVVRALHAAGQAGLFDEALHLFRAEEARWPHSPDLRFVMADVLLELGVAQPHRARQVRPLIEQLLRRCLEIGEKPELPGAVEGRGSHLARHNLTLVQRLGAV